MLLFSELPWLQLLILFYFQTSNLLQSPFGLILMRNPGCRLKPRVAKLTPWLLKLSKGLSWFVSGRPLRPIVSLLCFFTLSACLFIFVCESYFRIHDRLHLAPISTIKMTSIGCKASFQRSMAVSMGRIWLEQEKWRPRVSIWWFWYVLDSVSQQISPF